MPFSNVGTVCTEALRTNYTELLLSHLPINVYTVIISALYCLVLWRLFSKTNIAPWRSVIPVVNVYSLFKICWDGYMLWVEFFLFVFASRYYYMAKTPGLDGLFDNGSNALFIAFSLLTLYVHYKFSYHLARSFGKNIAYALGLTFLPFVFLPYLAFGETEYVGNLSQKS